MLNLKLKKEIKRFFKSTPKEEGCGLILLINNEYIFFPCGNVSRDKADHCILDPLDYIKAEESGEIVAHVHSQADDFPSFMDNFTAFSHDIYCIIYCWNSDKFYIIEPKLKDYLDKDFKIGEYDCLELVRNYYREELSIDIKNYIRDNNWYKDNSKVIYENFGEEGFRKVSQYHAIKNDVLLFGDGENIYHMGVFLGKDLMLHHPRDGKSSIEYLGIHLKNKISAVIRHKNYNE